MNRHFSSSGITGNANPYGTSLRVQTDDVFYIKLTAQNSTQNNYAWTRVTRSPTGVWQPVNQTGGQGFDPAYEINNQTATVGQVYRAWRDPESGQLLFFYSKGGSGPCPPCPSAVTFTLNWKTTNASGCNNYGWLSPYARIGWVVDESGSSNPNGTAVISKIVLEWQYTSGTDLTWHEYMTIDSDSDPDPRKATYYWNPTAANVNVRATYYADYCAVTTMSEPRIVMTQGAGVYAAITGGKFISPVVNVKSGGMVIDLTGTFQYQTLNAPAIPSPVSTVTAEVVSVTSDAGSPAAWASYVQGGVGFQGAYNYIIRTSSSTINSLAFQAGSSGQSVTLIPASNGFDASTMISTQRTQTGCDPSVTTYPYTYYPFGATTPSVTGGSVQWQGWVQDPLDQYGFAPMDGFIDQSCAYVYIAVPTKSGLISNDFTKTYTPHGAIPEFSVEGVPFASYTFYNAYAQWIVKTV